MIPARHPKDDVFLEPELAAFITRLSSRGLNIDGFHFFPTLTPQLTERIYYSQPSPQNKPPEERKRSILPINPGWQFIRLDYGQIEPRILHNILRQRGLIAWDTGDDLYQTLVESTGMSRSDAKKVVNSIAYGGRVDIDLCGHLREYAEAVMIYRNEIASMAKVNGFVETLSTRRISMADDQSHFEGAAIARMIQGTAADAFNHAVMVIDRQLECPGLPAHVAFLCHDELWIETAPFVLEEVKDLACNAMLNSVRLKAKVNVPIRVEVGDIFPGPAPVRSLQKKPEPSVAVASATFGHETRTHSTEKPRLISPSDTITTLKELVDVRILAKELGISVLGNGSTAHCFNKEGHANGDRNPSLLLFANGFKCCGARCGVHGDVFELLKLVRGMDFVSCKKMLMDRFGLVEDRSIPPLKKTQLVKKEPQSPRVHTGRRDLMRRLYDLVDPLELTPEACRYLEGRGINPSLAHELGCRDWRPAAEEIRSILSATPTDILQKSGFIVPTGGRWYPVHHLIEAGSKPIEASGLAFPAFLPNDDTPIQWRWRFYNIPRGRGKSDAMSDRTIGALPLGLSGSNPPLGILADTVIIAEGEPDYLSFYQASLDLQVRFNGIEVIGLCTHSWQPGWTKVLSRTKKILICLHKTDQSEKVACDIILALQSELGSLNKAKSIVLRQLLSERRDGNDLLKQGKLQVWLQKLLGHAWPDDLKTKG